MSCLKHNSISFKNFTLKNLSKIFSLFLANSLFLTIYHLSLAVSFSLNKLCTINFIDVCVCVCLNCLCYCSSSCGWGGLT